jgi:hypothetical protein
MLCIVRKKVVHSKWMQEEKAAVEKHLAICFRDKRTPRLHECVDCKRIEPVALAKRSARNIKDYVHNKLTSLKRQKEKEK